MGFNSGFKGLKYNPAHTWQQKAEGKPRGKHRRIPIRKVSTGLVWNSYATPYKVTPARSV